MRRTIRALALAAGGLVVLGSLTACGGDDDGGDASAVEDLDTTTTEAGGDPDSTTTTLVPEEAAWADLTAGYQAVAALSAAPDPASPQLEKYYTGDALAGLQNTMRDLQAGGAAQTTVDLHQYSVSVGGDAATVDYCFVDTTQRLDTSGQPTGTPEVTSMRANAQLQLIDGTWKLSQTTIEPEQCPGS